MIEGPYKLPKGWRWVRLGEVCTYERQTIDPRRYPHQEFLLFSIPAYDNNKQPELRKGSEIGSLKLKIKPNICLFSKLNPRIPRAWVIKSDESISDLPMLASTEFLALRPYTHLIDLDYLGLSLLSNVFLSQFQVGVTGATSSRQRLKQEDVLNALIPLPPLEEQKRIVARVEELMSRIKEVKKLREETKKQTELLWQSVLAETFPQPGTQLPKGWRWVRLGEVCSKPQYGLTQSASTTPVGPKFLRITDITSGYIDWEKVPYCRIGQHELDKYRLDEGDLLFARSGSIGATILIKEKPPYDAVFASYLIRVRLNKSLVHPEFLYLFTRSLSGQEQLIPRGATQKNINAKFIQSLLIPLPPLEEQKCIANFLQEVHEKIKELKEVQAKTEEEIKLLEQSILEKAFRGEL
ncbi:MAG: restriction endonuclease subunit S [Caldimicrobium sp.]|nr:restriction endonuclease subunit S [Caldimicrobium sp.]